MALDVSLRSAGPTSVYTRSLHATNKVAAAFDPWDSVSRTVDPEMYTYPRVTTASTALLKEPPRRVTMLVRDLIDDSLYNPNYGYFAKQAVIFSPEKQFDFGRLRDHLQFMDLLNKMYRRFDEQQGSEDVDYTARQVWHTPTELFKPWYGYAIAKYMVAEYKLNLYPHRDLIIYEMGAGNGTLMRNILDYIREYEPAVYTRTQYRIIEISEALAKQQARQLTRVNQKEPHHCVEIINQSIFDWDEKVEDECFFIAMEVIDNFAHDLIRYDTDTGEPFQGVVGVDPEGDYSELYEAVGSDALIARYLKTRRQTNYKTPALSHHIFRKLKNSLLPYSSNLSKPEFIPTRLFQFLEQLRDHFPRHRLILSDFYQLPDTIPGIDAPVVQTRYKGTMVPCSTYMVQPGWFDIFFPTNFELLRDMYHIVCRKDRPINERLVKVLPHRDFLERYADLEMTRTRSGENPMLMYYENVKMLLT
ncbi:hypothetical protein BZG36_01858 [Bifiguratus adelaidae]|uniref:Protein arginine methyltransferase NDUFAF7 n=1 Tax=Bifiguratus adelaidae TaxID=1938954 RepID=A0A261Y2F5_9FUNG|nr:hypothetical protein BZG36_01858 [Bifiguratus adelaidae]